MRSILFLLLLITILISCTQRHTDLLEVNEVIPTATIRFLAPKSDSIYTKGDTIHIEAIAISTADLHGYDLAVFDAGTGSNLYFIHIHDHNDTVRISEKWKSERTSASNIDAEITVYLDHLNHTKKERITFHLQ